jgi:hypothetical protein
LIELKRGETHQAQFFDDMTGSSQARRREPFRGVGVTLVPLQPIKPQQCGQALTRFSLCREHVDEVFYKVLSLTLLDTFTIDVTFGSGLL